MRMMTRHIISTPVLIAVALCSRLVAQSAAPPVEFDVVSIKLNTGGLGATGGLRRLPDGTLIMTNQPMVSLIGIVSPEPVLLRDVVGLPDWMNRERYDVTVKPPAGATREQLTQMWKAMFADRLKLVAHVEHREQTTFSLVVARGDGRLGPQLKPSALDCSTAGAASAPPPQPGAGFSDVKNRCGMAMNGTSIISGGTLLDTFARSLSGLAGGLVNNSTGLQGYYALTLTFSQPRGLSATPDPARLDEAPDVFTAVQEQLGLKLVPQKAMVPVLVIDHIERPSEN